MALNDTADTRPLMSGSLLRRLREEILSQPTGVSLGTETEIADRFTVGRATLRQAARILEQEQLITVQRGAKGGYVSRRPDVEGLARASTLYLSLRRATLKHLSVASRVLNVEVYRLAAMSDDEEKREKLRRTVDELKASYHRDMSVSEYLRRGEKIRNCILELSDNPFLELFLRIVYFFGAQLPTSVFTNAPDRIERMEARQWRVGEAILNREPEVTAALNAEGWRMIESWLDPHEGAQALTYVEEPKAPSGRGRRRRQAA
jgi:DNA-binding FadR family transcriptional regulator